MCVCDCSGPLMGKLKSGETVTLDSGAVVSNFNFPVDFELKFTARNIGHCM